MSDDNYFMLEALDIAKQASKDVPVGAVIVKNKKIIAAFHNEKEIRNDVTAHAEILCLKKASEVSWHEYTIYHPNEPQLSSMKLSAFQQGAEVVEFAHGKSRH